MVTMGGGGSKLKTIVSPTLRQESAPHCHTKLADFPLEEGLPIQDSRFKLELG